MPRLTSRARRRVVARLLESTRRDEVRYVRALRRVAQDFHTQTIAWLNARTDAAFPSGFDLHLAEVVAAIPSKVGPIFDRHAANVSKANKSAMRVVGINAPDFGLETQIAKRRAENIDLVINAQRAYAQSVKEVFEAPENFGLRVEELKQQLLERGDVSESRAELIARDQTLKLNGAITELRQTNAGVEEYVWSTSGDERVRDEHAALDGQTFSWSSAPAVGHPGEDFQCRCVALPVIAELADL